ncbi:MAG: ATP-binding protein [Acidimicrobiales bacterium]
MTVPVGRAASMDALLGAWVDAQRGCRLAVVRGVTGAGKSYLVDAVARQVAARGGLVLHASGRWAERSVFLHPLVEVIADHLEELHADPHDSLIAGWEGALHQLLPDTIPGPTGYGQLSPELEHRQSLQAVAAVLGRIAARHPTLLIVENLHHTAASALEAIDLARSTLHTAPLLIVGTVRVEPGLDLSDLLAQVDVAVEVGAFDLEATATLAEAAGVGRLAEAIHEATGGDPLFVVEAIRLAAEAGTDVALDALAGSVRDVVEQRTRRCGSDVDELLRLAATYGAVFDLDDVAELGSLSPEDAARRADRALAAGLVTVRQDRFAFASKVLRDVLYSSTPPPIRVSRHRRAALGAPTPEARARHLDAAGQHDAATEAWTEGADDARRRFANRDADRLLSAALASAMGAGSDRRSIELLMTRAAVRVDLVRYGDARADLDLALQRARDLGAVDLEARSLSGLGWAAYYARDAEMASDYAVRALVWPRRRRPPPEPFPGLWSSSVGFGTGPGTSTAPPTPIGWPSTPSLTPSRRRPSSAASELSSSTGTAIRRRSRCWTGPSPPPRPPRRRAPCFGPCSSPGWPAPTPATWPEPAGSSNASGPSSSATTFTSTGPARQPPCRGCGGNWGSWAGPRSWPPRPWRNH